MQRINEDIKSGNFKQIYLLYGEERYLRRQYRNKLKEAISQLAGDMNTHFFEGKDIDLGEIINLAESFPFMSEKRVIFLSDSGLFRTGGEKIADYLKTPNETTILVFTESEVDKRSRLYKAVKADGCVVEFTVQDENVLIRWIAGKIKKEGKRVTENTLRLFLLKVGTDMDNISMELEKLICYCIDRDVIAEADVEAVCTNRIGNHIFDMINAIADKQTDKALNLYYDLLALKEPPMRILFLITRQCNLLLQAKELKGKGYDNKAIGGKFGLPPFIAAKYVTQAARFGMSNLKKALIQCVEAEEAVKTGQMNDSLSVELLILSVFKEGVSKIP